MPAHYSSVAKKILMALSGLFLCLFLLVHLGGNLMLFKNDNGEAFNAYSRFMEHNLGILAMEVILFAGFFLHIVDGIVLTIKNKRARGQAYALSAPSANSTWVSRNMGFTGSVIFAFLVIHINSFTIHQRFLEARPSMYEAVKAAFANPAYCAFYVVAISFLALHLNHGFQSTFQSLGFNHEKFNPWIKNAGLLFSIVVPLGFIAMPVYFFFAGIAGL